MSKFMEILRVRAALIHADRLRDMTKVRGFFRDLWEDALNREPDFLLCSCLVQLGLFVIIINVSLFSFSVESIT